MKRLSPRNTRGTAVLSTSLPELLSIIPNFLPLLPNEQVDTEVQAAGEIPALASFDFRGNKTLKTGSDGKEVKPSTLTVYDTKFTDLFRLGSFIYAVKDPVAGLSHFGDLLFVMMNPNRLFEGRNAEQQSPRRDGSAKEINQRALSKARQLLAIGGLDYMKACFEHARDLANKRLPVVIVLGEQVNDRDVNLEPYDCDEFITCCERENNVHQYATNQTAERKGIPADIDIFHVNMKAFENAQIDSGDIEKLLMIYQFSLAENRPLIIHCTDGMDRSGGLALAYQLFHNWGRVFTSLSATEIVGNIKREHEAMQQQRGPSFCTATSKRIQGAVLLAGIMKAIQKSKQLIERNVPLANELNQTDYLQQIYLLEEKDEEGNSELLKTLKARLTLEKLYFEKFSPEINHPQVDLFTIESILNEDLNEVSDGQKGNLEKKFFHLKANYRKEGFNSEALRALEDLKCDVETYLATHQIDMALRSISNTTVKEDINKKLSTIDSKEETKSIKLKRKKILLLELRALKLYEETDKLLEDPDFANHSTASQFKSLKTILNQNLREAQFTDPNVGKIENLFLKLEKLQKNMHESKTQDTNSQLDTSKKNLTGSLRLRQSPPTSRRGSVLMKEAPPSIEGGSDSTLSTSSTSPRRSFLGLSKSPSGSRRESRAQAHAQGEDSIEGKQVPSEYSTGDSTTSQKSGLGSSLSQLFKNISPRGSRVLTTNDTDLSASRNQVFGKTPAAITDSEEFRQALANLAAEQGISDRVQRTFETSPRASRKPKDPAEDNKRKSYAADEDLPNNGNSDEELFSDIAKITGTF